MREDLHIVVDEPQLAAQELARVREKSPEAGEVWVERGTARLGALIGEGRAWLMFLRHDGDPGFSSRNEQLGSSDERLRFTLSNGQVDEYPVAWTFTIEEAFRAMEAFAATGRVPDHIGWYNDSRDGCESPNDDRPG